MFFYPFLALAEPLLHIYKCNEAPATNNFMKTALAEVFLHRNLSSAVLKLGQARENLRSDEASFLCRYINDCDKSLEKLVTSAHFLLKNFFADELYESHGFPVLSQKIIYF